MQGLKGVVTLQSLVNTVIMQYSVGLRKVVENDTHTTTTQ